MSGWVKSRWRDRDRRTEAFWVVASSDSTAEKGSNTTPEMVLASWADAAGGVSVVRDSRRGEDALEVVASFKLVRREKFERYVCVSLSLSLPLSLSLSPAA